MTLTFDIASLVERGRERGKGRYVLTREPQTWETRRPLTFASLVEGKGVGGGGGGRGRVRGKGRWKGEGGRGRGRGKGEGEGGIKRT